MYITYSIKHLSSQVKFHVEILWIFHLIQIPNVKPNNE